MQRRIKCLLAILGLLVGTLMPPGLALASSSTFTPSYAAATRAQFAVIAVEGLGLATATPVPPTYSDVPATHTYYKFVEGATAAGLVRGLGNGKYGPDLQISRQQVATILARYLSAAELSKTGYVTGSAGTHYASLDAWYQAEGEQQLAVFADQARIATVHRPGVAYLAMHAIALGSNGSFVPLNMVTQIQSSNLVQRAASVAATFSQQSPAPTVTSLSPSTGSSAGGTTVTIHGTGFASGAAVYFGSKPASSVTVNSSTLVTAVSPSGTAGGVVKVTVTTTGGTSADTAAASFTYEAASSTPSVSSVSPSSGLSAGGTTVYVYGTNFTSGAAVYFGSTAATGVTVNSSTSITAVSPSGTAGNTVHITVTTAGGTSTTSSADHFTYNAATSVPAITYLSPDSGWEGDSVIIYGSGFYDDGLAVYFGGTQVDSDDIELVSSTELTAVAPEGTDGTTVRVSVVTDYGISPNTSADDFTYEDTDDAPTITSLSPSSGWEGDLVTIHGTGFDETGLEVYFGSAEVASSDIEVVSSTQLTVVVPTGTLDTTVRVKVVNDYGTSPNTSADDFTYETSAPSITSLSPSSGLEGETVTIYGTHFYDAGLEVYFGSAEVDSSDIDLVSSTELAVIAPAGSDDTTVRVKVVTDYGTSPNTSADDFTYSGSAPAITSLNPDSGLQGDTVTIYGTHFYDSNLQVYFGSEEVDGSDITVVSSGELTVVVPAGTDGATVRVKVMTDYGTSPNTSADDFTYSGSAPAITALNPGSGWEGDTITVYGSGFYDNSLEVYFGSAEVDGSDITVVSPTELTVVVPEGTDGATVRVKVMTDYGTSPNTSADDFTYDQPTYTITASVNEGSYGTISPSGSVSVGQGEDQSFTVTAASGYHIATLVVDGATVSAATDETSYTYDFSDVTADHTVVVTFEADTD